MEVKSIVAEFLKDSEELNLSRTDLSNSHSFFCVVNSLEERLETPEEKKKKTRVDLEHCHLGHKNFDLLCGALEKNMKKEFSLFLSWNPLGERGVEHLGRLLTSSHLTKLSLDGVGMGDKGFINLLKAMGSSGGKLTHLSVGYNNIGRAGMFCLISRMEGALSSISSLCLSHNDMSQCNVSEISECFLKSSLEELDISSNSLGAEGACALLSEFVAKSKKIKVLDLSNNNIGDKGAQSISSCLQLNSSLLHLNIGSNNISYRGCAALVDGLHINKTLRVLDLSRTHASQVALGIEGARQLSYMVRLNRSLTDLNLHWCDIQSAGAIFLATALQHNRTLRRINLSGNYIGPEAIRRLEEGMTAVYKPRFDEWRPTVWDSKVPITPYTINRRASPVEEMSLPEPSANMESWTCYQRGNKGISVNSRKSVVITAPPALKLPSKATKDKIKDIFSIAPHSFSKVSKSSILPGVRESLMAVENISMGQCDESSDTYPSSTKRALQVKGPSKIKSMFQI